MLRGGLLVQIVTMSGEFVSIRRDCTRTELSFSDYLLTYSAPAELAWQCQR